MSIPPRPPPPLPSLLARYRPLSKLAGVPVSPIALGGLSVGETGEKMGLGFTDKESSFELLDAYFDVSLPCCDRHDPH